MEIQNLLVNISIVFELELVERRSVILSSSLKPYQLFASFCFQSTRELKGWLGLTSYPILEACVVFALDSASCPELKLSTGFSKLSKMLYLKFENKKWPCPAYGRKVCSVAERYKVSKSAVTKHCLVPNWWVDDHLVTTEGSLGCHLMTTWTMIA